MAFWQDSTAEAKHKGLSSAKQLALGNMMYCADWDKIMPYAQNDITWIRVLMPYLKNRDVMFTHNPAKSDFKFNLNLAGVSLVRVSKPQEMPLVHDEKPWQDGGRLVGYLDGSVRMTHLAEWERASKRLKETYVRTAKKPLPKDHFKKDAGF